MKKLSKFILTVLCLSLLFACSNEIITDETPQKQPQTSTTSEAKTQTVRLSVGSSRTLLPSSITPVKKYVFTLTSTTDPKTVYTAESETSNVTIEKVLLGSYSVNVKGYADTAKTVLTQEGHSDTDLKVTTTGQNSTVVQMQIMTGEGLTGSIKIPVDWSQVASHPAFAAALKDGIRFNLYIDKVLQDDKHILKGEDYPENNAELLFENIPSGIGKMVNIELYNDKTGQLLVRNFFNAMATINGGLISEPDANEVNSGILKQNQIVTASNISAVKVTYNPDNLDSALDITWKNPQSNGNNLTKTVTFKYSTEGEEELEHIVVFKEANTATDHNGKTTIANLTPGKSYTIKYSLQYFNGMYSSEYKLPYKVTPYVFVSSLLLDNDSIPTNALVEGNAFGIKATITPENASDKTINWTSSDDSVLTFNNGLFEAHKPGKAKIKATTTGYINSKQETLSQDATREVSVILKAPVVYAEVEEHKINVSWDAINYAEQYELHEVIDGVEQQVISLKAPTTTYTKDTDIKSGASYEYYVIAKAPSLNTSDFTADSEHSNKTTAVTPVVPNITVKDPVLSGSPTLTFGSESVDRVISTEQKELIFKIENPDSKYTYSWKINGKTVESTIDNGNTIIINKDTVGIYQDTSASINTLMLVARTDNAVYSATTTFEVIAVMDEGVNVYINGEAEGKCFIPKSDGNVLLSYQVLPEDASNQTVSFESSNKSVATVNDDGVITILSAGDTTITVKPVHGKATTIDFKFYDQTFKSSLDILNAVNSVLRTHIEAANSKFGGDWWAISNKNGYSATGVEIKHSSLASQTAGSITLNDVKASSQFGEFTLNTTEKIQTWATDGGGWTNLGYNGTDPLHMIGYDNKGTIKVDLPYEQGSVSIHYSNIIIDGDRSGNYSLTFEPITVGGKTYQLMDNTSFNDNDTSITINRLFN